MQRIKYGPNHLRREALLANALEIVDVSVSLVTLGNYRSQFHWNYITKTLKGHLGCRS